MKSDRVADMETAVKSMFAAFQENLQDWLAGPPVVGLLRVLGSYRLF